MDSLLLSRRKAAAMLSISLRTLDYLIARKEIVVRRVGSRVLIPCAALENFARRDHATRPTGAGKADGDAC